MSTRFAASLLLVLLTASQLRADTVIVDDDFESYNTSVELRAVWEPRIGSGAAAPFFDDDGILTSDDTFFPGLDGNGVDHLGSSVMQHSAVTPASPIFATPTQNIQIQGDIFVRAAEDTELGAGDNGNSRMSIGLRNRSIVDSPNVGNLLEMGLYNADGLDPTDGVTPVTGTNFGYRLVLFDELGDEALVQQPNWLYFELDPALDTNEDEVVNLVDVGDGWHTYTATITETTVTMELDLFRDGLDNGQSLTDGMDVAGIDASVTWQLGSTVNGFDSFRIGSPSGISSEEGVAFDNVSLILQDVVTVGGTDTEPDGDVDGTDFLALQRDDSSLIGQWQSDYPLTPSLSASSVPEPTSIAIMLISMAGFVASRRR